MRYAKQISTGKIIESQSGGNPDNPLHLSTLVDNAVGLGMSESDIEVGYADDEVVAGWLVEQTEQAKTYSDRRATAYASLPDQLDMLFWDKMNGTEIWKNNIIKIKEKFLKE
jgi:hypothetical protein